MKGLIALCLSAAFGLTVSATPVDSLTHQRVHRLDTVRVVANRRAHSVRTSSPLQLMGQDFRRYGVLTMADALKHFAGVTLRDYGGAGGMKTVSVRGIGARHTAVVYDGITLTDGQTGELDVARYSLNNLSAISLYIGIDDDIFCPARNQTQAAALRLDRWAVIANVLSSHRRQASAVLSTGSWGQFNANLNLAEPLSASTAMSLSGEYQHADNAYPFRLRNGAYTLTQHRHNSRMNSGHLEANILTQLSSNATLRGKVYHYQNNRHLPGIVHYYTTDSGETLAEQNSFTQWQYRQRLAKAWQLMANAKFNYAKTDYHNPLPSGGITDACYWQRELYASFSLHFKPTEPLALNYSGDYAWHDLRSTLQFYGHPHRQSVFQSLSAKWQNPRLKVILLGLLSTHSDHQNQSTSVSHTYFSPSLSLSYRLFSQRDIYFRLLFKDVSRMPTFNELYFFHIGTTLLQPERCRQVNIGLTLNEQLSARLTLDATLDVYMNRIKDKIVAVPFNMFVWRMMNAHSVTSRGVDFVGHADWQLTSASSLSIALNYSYLRAENRTRRESVNYRNQIPYTPAHSLCVALAWNIRNWTAACSQQFISSRWTTMDHSQGTRMSGYSLLDLSLSYQPHFKRLPLTLQMDLKNVLNKQYEVVAHYPMSGRQWRFTLKMNLP